MQSLRTRRSQAPPRRPQQRPPGTSNKLSKPAAGPTPRDTRKSRVDDKIKKRMSMRYADISNPTDLNVPAMPSLPVGLGGGMRGGAAREQDEVVKDRSGTKEDERAVGDDKKLLDKEDFDPDAFLKIKLANSTEAELKALQSSLRSATDDIASDLQRNVFKNYAEFVLISKEISTLETEMLELKESLSEYKSMPSLLHIPDPSSTSSSTFSSYRRSSVADLRIMYFNQMQTLHAQIEGSAKFAPTTPGRHVVGEVDGVLALNTATYKVMGKVKFVVLDDIVLVAKRRRRNAGGGAIEARGGSISEGKLVAERCWPLGEMLVLDTKDTPSMTNVFKVRHGKETHVYRTEAIADKKSLLAQFRHVAEELAAKKRKEREGEHERRKSMWHGGDRNASAATSDRVPPVPDWMSDLAQRAGAATGTDAKEKAERDSRWVSEWADELTVAIALKEWEKGVGLVEQGKAKLSITPPLTAKLPPLTSQLTASILTSLSLPTNRKCTVVSLISLLLRLSAGPAARNTFLAMRTQVMQSHVRKIRFEGHIGAYVGDLTMVCFTGIKHTADWFLASFKENEVASAFIDWAQKQITTFAEIFRRQVYSSDVDPKTVDDAKKIVYSQSKKLLQEYGLDFRFLFDELLLENPKIKETPTPSAPISFPKNPLSKPAEPTRTAGIPPSIRRRSPGPRPVSPPPISQAPTHTTSTSSTLNSTTSAPSMPSAYPSSSAHTAPSPFTTSSTYTVPLPSAPPQTPLSARGRTPNSATVAFSRLSAPAPPVPLVSPAPRRARSPPASASPVPQANGLANRERPPRPSQGSPAPPPRSMNRPGSAMNRRPPPVAVPQREGMI